MIMALYGEEECHSELVESAWTGRFFPFFGDYFDQVTARILTVSWM